VGFSRTTVAALLAVVAAALLAGDLSAASPKERLHEKRAQAAAVLAQVNALDQRFEASVEAWNGARYELGVARQKLKVDRARLRTAARQRRVALARLEERVRAVYESPEQPTTLGILLGASSLSDLLDRLNAANAVAAADHQLATQTEVARAHYARVARETAAVAERRAVALEQRTRERRQIGAMLAERKRLLASVQAEVVTLQAAERAQQARLAAEARARLAAAQAAAARERAAKEAAAAARERAAEHTTTSVATTPDPAPAPATTTTTTLPDPSGQTDTTPSVDPGTAPAPGLGAGHPDAATIALQYLGVPYLWGGATPAGFDCSGLVMYVYAQLGISLPHYAAAQYQVGTPVPRDELQPGDLVFFDALNHVGIYIGGGQFVHAPHTGDVVKISSLSDFAGSYVGARRL
jgi:cell wall-associated NlpC family hydrolase